MYKQSMQKQASANNKIWMQTALPSIEQFYCVSLERYIKMTLQKIENHFELQDHQQQFTNSSIKQASAYLKYHKVSDQQLLRRGYFLSILYELIIFFKQISQQLNKEIIAKLSHKYKFLNFSCWIKDMAMSMEQLTKLTRLKSNIHKDMDDSIQQFNKKLIPLLYETQIYALQMMIRIIIFKETYEQNAKYLTSLDKLQSSFKYLSFPQYQSPILEGQQHNQRDKINNTKILKYQQRQNKQFFKQINKILKFYQCQLSINRSDCTLKPELLCLLQLLEQKISIELFQQILSKSQLRRIAYKRKLSFKKVFSPLIVPPNMLQNNQSYQSHKRILKLSRQQTISIICHNENRISCTKIQQESNIQRKSQGIHIQPTIKLQQSNQDIKSTTKNVQIERGIQLQKAKNNRQKHKIVNRISNERKRQLQSRQKSGKSHKHRRTMTKLSQRQRLKFIGENQRFGQNRCNLQKRLIKLKKQRSSSQERFQQQTPKQFFRIMKESSFNYIHGDDSQDNMMILADETPNQRKRPFLLHFQQE